MFVCIIFSLSLLRTPSPFKLFLPAIVTEKEFSFLLFVVHYLPFSNPIYSHNECSIELRKESKKAWSVCECGGGGIVVCVCVYIRLFITLKDWMDSPESPQKTTQGTWPLCALCCCVPPLLLPLPLLCHARNGKGWGGGRGGAGLSLAHHGPFACQQKCLSIYLIMTPISGWWSQLKLGSLHPTLPAPAFCTAMLLLGEGGATGGRGGNPGLSVCLNEKFY